MRLLGIGLVLLFAATATAQTVPQIPDPYFPAPPEVAAEAAKLDGTPFELDSNATREALQAFSDDVSGARIHDCIQTITTDAQGLYRVMGTPTQDQFLQKYGTVFSDLGLPSGRQDFADGGPGVPGVGGGPVDTGGTNLIGVLPGRDLTTWVVLGAHYDTQLLTQGGGAYDNTSGICTIQELARAMKGYVDRGHILEASVVFVWYDGEEWGLYGSVAFANDTSVAKQLLGLPTDTNVTILASQSYDMAGLNWPATNNWAGFGDPTTLDKTAVLNLRTAPIHADQEWTCWSYGCYEELKARPDIDQILRRNTDYQFLVREVAHDFYGCPPDYCWVFDDNYGRSDHIPLIAQGSPGNRVQGSHDFEYPHYHYPTDTLAGLYELAGSKEALIHGFDTEARIGGTTAFYVAMKGNVGSYGYVERGDAAPSVDDVATSDQTLPGPSVVIWLGLALVSAVGARRRQG